MDSHELPTVSRVISRGLEQYGLADRVDPQAAGNLCRYCQALLEKNREMNLTAITDPVDAANLHMLDCAALLNCADFSGKTLIDVGTGAGFPGMVLKLLVPSLELTLLDSLNKRLDWLAQLGGALEVQGMRTVHARAEDAGQDPALRERFDFASARAVAGLRLLCELCLPFVKVGGLFLAMKSTASDGEVADAAAALQTLGGQVRQCFDYAIPGTEVVHRVVMVEKISPTPLKYPRRWGKIQRSPL